jgi:hypothetical protein
MILAQMRLRFLPELVVVLARQDSAA